MAADLLLAILEVRIPCLPILFRTVLDMALVPVVVPGATRNLLIIRATLMEGVTRVTTEASHLLVICRIHMGRQHRIVAHLRFLHSLHLVPAVVHSGYKTFILSVRRLLQTLIP